MPPATMSRLVVKNSSNTDSLFFFWNSNTGICNCDFQHLTLYRHSTKINFDTYIRAPVNVCMANQAFDDRLQCNLRQSNFYRIACFGKLDVEILSTVVIFYSVCDL